MYIKTHRSAPAQLNILLMRRTWKGWTRTRRWKASLPATFVTYLFAQIRAASRASDESCSYSSETRWQQKGNSSTDARLRPKSKIRICRRCEQNNSLPLVYSILYLRVGDTTVVPRLRVRLVLAITVAASGTAAHFDVYKQTNPQVSNPYSFHEPSCQASSNPPSTNPSILTIPNLQIRIPAAHEDMQHPAGAKRHQETQRDILTSWGRRGDVGAASWLSRPF